MARKPKRKIEDYFHSAVVCQNSKRLREAIHLYDELLLLMPTHFPALTNKGMALYQLGLFNEAAGCFTQHVKISFTAYGYYLNKGIVLAALGENDEALCAYDSAIACKNDSPEPHFNKGVILQLKKKWREAKISYDLAISHNKSFGEAYSNRALIHQNIGEMLDAEADFHLALAYQNNISTRYAYAIFLLTQGAQEKSISILHELILENGAHQFKVGIILAIISFSNSQFISAKRHLEFAENLHHNDDDDKPFAIYKLFLTRLLSWKEAEPEWYLPKSDEKTLYVIGESHSLTAQSLKVSLGTEKYTCQSMWIMGAKQFHFYAKEENKFKYNFRAHATKIPEGSLLMVAIGEIDTRADEGFVKNHSESGEEIEISIKKVVDGYFNFLSNEFLNRDIRLIIHGVPSPVIPTARREELEQALRIKVIRLVNKYMQLGAIKYGYLVVPAKPLQPA